MRRRRLQREWTVRRLPAEVIFEGKSIPVFPVVNDKGRPVLFSPALRTGCYATMLPDFHSLLYELIETCSLNEPPDVLLAWISDKCHDMLRERYQTYHQYLGAEPRRRTAASEYQPLATSKPSLTNKRER